MMKIRVDLFMYILIIFLFGCDSNDERGIRDSREGFMIELRSQLKENNIPFKTDSTGHLRYSNKYKDTVEMIIQQIDETRTNEVGVKFQDEISTLYFRKLLDEKGKIYRMESQKGEKWIFWYPDNEDQEKEITMKVVTYAFEKKENKQNEKK